MRFWWHAMRRKNYIEVVRSPVGEEPVGKYPIVKLADWELPSLLKLPADTLVDDRVLARLAEWIRGLNTALRLAHVPRGVPLVGGVEEVAWGAGAASAPSSGARKSGRVGAAGVGGQPQQMAAGGGGHSAAVA